MLKTVHLDYETRSGANVIEVGAHRHAIDPRFEILMAAVSDDEPGSPVYLWVNPEFRTPDQMGENQEAIKLLASAEVIYAHNASFEQACTWGAHEQGKESPFWKGPPNLNQWRCTAATARKAGLPYSLAQLSETLQLADSKDRKGKALIKLFSEPQEDGRFINPCDRPAEFFEFGEYCRQDVRAEKEVGRKLKPFELAGAQLETFQFDLRMNQRGVPINMAAARHAQQVIDEVQAGVVEEFRKITGLNPTQREKVSCWLDDHGLVMPDMTGPTVEWGLIEASKRGNALVGQVLDMYQKVSYAAVKKVQTMLDCACPDGRLRGMFMFYGAGTGRWSAQRLQPHNFKKTPPWMRTKEDDITDAVYSAFCAELPAYAIEQLYGEPLEVLSGVIRNFIHLPGHEMLDGDFAQVEARIICWLAGQADVLQMWREGIDLYKWMAGHVYEIAQEVVNPDQREVGKRVILGCFDWNTPVLTQEGLKPMGLITSRDWLWDGLDWVQSEGVIYQGCQKTIPLSDVLVTCDHPILCGKTWLPASSVGQDGNTQSRASALALASFGLLDTELVNVEEWSDFLCDVLAEPPNTASTPPVCREGSQPAATNVPNEPVLTTEKSIGVTPTSFPTTRSVSDCLTAFLAVFPVATAKRMRSIITMEGGASMSSLLGGTTEKNFSATSSRSNTIQKLRETLIALRSMEDTNRAISGSLRNEKTFRTGGILRPCRSESSNSKPKIDGSVLRPVYDIANCGPRNRFTIWTAEGPMIAHNCGFQMGWRRFIKSCKELYQLDVPKDIAKKGIKLFRTLCGKIRDYWWTLNNAATQCIETGQPCGAFSVRRIAGIPYLLFRLRSGRSLAYPYPEVKLVQWVPEEDDDDENEHRYDTLDKNWKPREPKVQWRKEITYWGQIPGSGQWGRIKLYGGKLAENETQATAADFMAYGAIEAEKRGMEPFMLVHDQALALRTNGQTVKDYEAALGALPAWATGFPMKVEVKLCSWYKK